MRYAIVIAAVATLAGCSTNRADTAWKLIERQQEEQALVRQYEMAQSRRQTPDSEELLLQMIQKAQGEGRYFASLAYIESFILENGATPHVLMLKADALRVTGHDAESEAIYQSLLKTALRAQAHHGLGLLAGGRGQYDLAVRELSAAAQLQPAQATILSDLGYALLRAGDIRRARLPLGQAAELEPDNATIISNLVLFLLLNNDHGQAEKVRTEAGMSDELFRSIASLALNIRAETSSLPGAGSRPVVSSGNTAGTVVRGEEASAGPVPVGHEPLIW